MISTSRLETNPQLSWYAIHTHPKQEARAESNLKAWGIETFYPMLEEVSGKRPGGALKYTRKPLFSRYLFARFDSDRSYHNVCYTRGVQSVIGYGGSPVAVDDEIISLIKMNVSDNGYIKLAEEFQLGDRVKIIHGPLKDMEGIFEKYMPDHVRVMVLLTAVTYQGRVVTEKSCLKKL